ncbi:MAG: glycosyltransferase family 4 protein, partial [Deltaproteobacteria bacterium]|nr:glycosyltransferase family 4 protein [Deltaproteobacteria bacterium]
MRILYCQKMIFPTHTAHAIHTSMTVANFAEAGAETVFFPGLGHGDAAEWRHFMEQLNFFSLPSSLEIRAIPHRHKGIYGLFFRWALLKAMLEKKRTLCYASNVKDACLALNLRKLLRIPARQLPVVFEIHHLISRLKQGRQAERLLASEKQAFAEADLVVFNSETLRKIAAGCLPAPKASLVSLLGFNEKTVKPVRCSTGGSASGAVINLVYTGSLQAGKGIELLIQALAFLPEKYRLTIIGGEGSPADDHSGILKQKFTDGRIKFIRQVPQAELGSFLEPCDIFVIPTTTVKNFFAPMKMYEAIGFNLPVVATPVPSISELLTDGKHAVFAGEFTPESFAEAILQVGESEALRARMRSANAALSVNLSALERARRLRALFEDKFMRQQNPALTWFPQSGGSLPSVRFRVEAPFARAKRLFHPVRMVRIPKGVIQRLSFYASIEPMDICIIQKRLLSTVELRLLKKKSSLLVYDFDDAVWTEQNAPREAGSGQYSKKFNQTCREVDLVIAANNCLASAVPPGVETLIMPTPIDTSIYRPERKEHASVPCLGWMGTAGYLPFVESVLVDLLDGLALPVCIVSNRAPGSRLLHAYVQWSPANELGELSSGKGDT